MIASANADWANVLVALIVGLPGLISAVYAITIHRKITTPSGKPLGQVAEYAHDTAIANNLLLSKANEPTKPADHDTLLAEGQTPPRIPAPPPTAPVAAPKNEIG